MKKTLAFIAAAFVALSASASSELSFDLGAESAVASQALIFDTEAFVTVAPNAEFLSGLTATASITSPAVVPEPAAAALLLISLAVHGLRQKQTRRTV